MSSLNFAISVPQSYTPNQPIRPIAPTSNGASSRNITNQISTLPPEAQREIKGVELVAKTIIAGLIGGVPFVVSKAGELTVKASVYSEEFFRKKVIDNLDDFGNRQLEPINGPLRPLRNVAGVFLFISTWSFEMFSRAVIGVPAAVGGILLTGGAVAFSKLQAQVWGQALIEHPQEERINTKLARYGAGDKPSRDLLDLLHLFFVPGCPMRYEELDNDKMRRIQYWKNFEAT